MAADELELVRELADSTFPGAASPVVERMTAGGSTRVYRVRKGSVSLYVRVLPEDGASFAPEALVHRQLAAKGAKVPKVVHFEHLNPVLRRSILVTDEIEGKPIGYGPPVEDLRAVLRDAGRDLATINSIPVQGFGWVRRDQPLAGSLSAEHAAPAAWVRSEVDGCVANLERESVLGAVEAETVRRLLGEMEQVFADEPACLAHGDFDVTHIYHDRGQYTGVIDFGEIRGTPQLYDLGHFLVDTSQWLPYLLEGYAERASLPPDYERRLHLFSLLIATRRLARTLRKGLAAYPPDLLAVGNSMARLSN